MKVLMALSGGVDSSVAAAELLAAGHEVVGITMRLWGGESDTGCCSIADVDDARRVAQQLGIDHLVFNFTDDFDRHVVEPYVDAHRNGITPNPCIECNRHLKFHRLSERADLLGFDAVATGHHARIESVDGVWRVARGHDPAKDQSYVVHMLPQRELARTLFPIGHLTKADVRQRATALGLRTAAKPDSQDVCFITHTGGRTQFLGDRIAFRRATVVDAVDGAPLGEAEALELVVAGASAWMAHDDASIDDTHRVARRAAMRSGLEVLRHAHNRGVGAAIATGYRRALELGVQGFFVIKVFRQPVERMPGRCFQVAFTCHGGVP